MKKTGVLAKSSWIALAVTVVVIGIMASCCTTIDSASVGIKFKKWSSNAALKERTLRFTASLISFPNSTDREQSPVSKMRTLFIGLSLPKRGMTRGKKAVRERLRRLLTEEPPIRLPSPDVP